ncbi:MAG TPA: helix-turn-helix transcriptional regulator [Bacteroidales bacterium]|nr:helix-turn-helix transcriptional regulator [Bacteroidales bacterium]MDY0084332.1 helix-turn-helix transcriptional regulator [Bacteroidales bacterium]HPE43571.1 helix-turn-helix transcriptional regulator [Bacteroidales bacterium]
MIVKPVDTLSKIVRHHFILRNMLCDCCLKVIGLLAEKHGFTLVKSRLGDVTVEYDTEHLTLQDITAIFKANGFEIIEDKETHLIEDIKRVVIELVHHSTYNAMVRNSDFIVGKFNMSYPHLSTVFSHHEGITLEKYIIMQRIEKVKELIQLDELSLSEIAYAMGYSSVQYLSTQFKKITGYSVSEYKALPEKERKGAGLTT